MDPIEAALAAAAGEGAPRATPRAPIPNAQALPAITDRIAALEGTGQNPRSSSRGVGQFTDATWLGTYRKHADTRGMSDAQVLALRADPATAHAMLGNLVADNAHALTSAGHDATPGNVYLANHFGAAGANAILRADPAMPLAQIVGPDVMRANPQLVGQTTGGIAQTLAGKMEGSGSGGTAPSPLAPAAADSHDPIDAALSAVADGRAFPTIAHGDGQAAVAPGQESVTPSSRAPAESWAQWAGHGLNDAGVGALRGVTDVLGTGAWVADKVRGTRWQDATDRAQADLAADQYHPDGWASTIGRLSGDMFATAPVAELQVAGRLGLTGKAAGAARATELAIQGGAAGGLASGGHDFGQNVVAGALLTPAISLAAEHVALPAALRAYGVARGIAAPLADTPLLRGVRDLRARLATQGAEDASAAVPGAMAAMPGWSADEAAQGWRRGPNGIEFPAEKVPARGVPADGEIGPDGSLHVNIYGGGRPEWKAAVDRMRADQGGVATAAINHPEIGSIDVPWGQRGTGDNMKGGFGLAKIVEKHPEVADNLPQIVEGLPVSQHPTATRNGQFVLEDETHRAVVAPDWHGDPQQWLVTAFEKKAPAGQVIHPGPPEAPEGLSSSAGAADPIDADGAGSNPGRRGLASIRQLPPEVQAHVDRLTAEGVPADQALREADAMAIGAKPTVADVTRDFDHQQAINAAADLPTPEGRALKAQHIANNAAAHGAVQSMIESYGGVPRQGEAMAAASDALAQAKDAARAKVRDLYTAADREAAAAQGDADLKTAWAQREADRNHAAQVQASARAQLDAAQAAFKQARALPGTTGAANVDKARQAVTTARVALRDATDNPPKAPPVPRGSSEGYVDMTPLRSFLASPDLADPTATGAGQLRLGLIGQLDAFAGKDGKLVTASQAEALRQSANDAFDPLGGGINSKIAGAKAAIDEAMDGADAGPSYKAARAAHREWAQAYEAPGISELTQRDASGAFIGAARKLDRSMLGQLDDRPFVGIVKQLRATGRANVVDRLKASVLQDAYEKASATAADSGNHPVLNGRRFLRELDKLGPDKLDALFTPQEQAAIASRGRAATTLNERVPKSENTSGTASTHYRNTLQGAMDAQNAKPTAPILKTIGRAAVHIGLSPITHGAASIAMEGAGAARSAVRAASQARQVAGAISEASDPAVARASSRAVAARLAEAERRGQAARTAAPRVATTATLAALLRQRQGEEQARREALIAGLRRRRAAAGR